MDNLIGFNNLSNYPMPSQCQYSHFYILFWTNTFWKSMNPSPTSYEVNSTTTICCEYGLSLDNPSYKKLYILFIKSDE